MRIYGLNFRKQLKMWYKQSLDLSSLTEKDGPSGYYGTFVSDFGTKEKKQLQQQLGTNADNIGVKFFREELQYNETPEQLKANMIAENLALYYMGDYINKHTNLRAPVPPIRLSLSSLLMNQHNFLITQTKKGVLISDEDIANEMRAHFGGQRWRIIDKIQNAVYERLKQANIYWQDCHVGNFFITPRSYQMLMKLDSDVDIQTVNWNAFIVGATIIDFGRMDVRDNDELYNKILALKNKIIPLIQSENKLQILNKVFDQLLSGVY